MIKITHHRSKCIGCGYCEEFAPYRWMIDINDGKVNLVGSTGKKGLYICQATDDELTEIRKAAELCPVKIIRVENIK